MTPQEHANVILRWLLTLHEDDAYPAEAIASYVGLDVKRTLAALTILEEQGDLSMREGTPTRWAASEKAREALPPPPTLRTFRVIPEDTKLTCDNAHELLDALLRRQGNKR